MLGIGAPKLDKLEAPATYRNLFNGYYMINQSGLTPLKWHLSWGAALPKQLKRTKGVSFLRARSKRVVHRLDEQGKGFFASKLRESEKENPLQVSNNAHGFIARRRRETILPT